MARGKNYQKSFGKEFYDKECSTFNSAGKDDQVLYLLFDRITLILVKNL